MAQVILYVPCPDRLSPRRIVNYGALSVATALKNHGVDVVYLDGAGGTLPEMFGQIDLNMHGCIYVGISCFTAVIDEAMVVSEFIKAKYPKVPILWGGIHSSLLPNQTAQSVDYVCAGEGDYTAVEFFDQLTGYHDLDKVHNLVWKDGCSPKAPFFDMQKQTHLAWELLDLEKYIVHNRFDGNCPSMGVPVARGCPNHCSFCINVALKDYGYTTYRKRLPQHVENDLVYLKQFGVRFSFIRDEVFFVDLEYSRQIAQVFHRNGILWGANVRANYFERITVDYLKEMKELGMVNGMMGVESGVPRLLKDVVNKGITLEQVEHGMDVMTQAGIRPFVSTMIGFPTETRQETRQTLDYTCKLKQMNPRTVISGISLLRPYPGAPIFNECVKQGLKVPQSLREWGDLELTRQGGLYQQQLPWLKGRENLTVVSEYLTHALMDIEKECGFALNVFIILARLRMWLHCYRLPWELKLYPYIRALLHRMKR